MASETAPPAAEDLPSAPYAHLYFASGESAVIALNLEETAEVLGAWAGCPGGPPDTITFPFMLSDVDDADVWLVRGGLVRPDAIEAVIPWRPKGDEVAAAGDAVLDARERTPKLFRIAQQLQQLG